MYPGGLNRKNAVLVAQYPHRKQRRNNWLTKHSTREIATCLPAAIDHIGTDHDSGLGLGLVRWHHTEDEKAQIPYDAVATTGNFG